MSKLSAGLKALINAAHARPNTIPAPSNIRSTYARIAKSAQAKSVGTPAWLTISTAATMTLNSPDSLLQLHAVASNPPSSAPASTTSPSSASSSPTSTSQPMNPVNAAELMREVGLKCISFNGIPRTINMLGAFYAGLPADVSSQLSTQPTRQLTNLNAEEIVDRGRVLWDSIYRPFEDKLVDKLAQSHPNLPLHIVSAHYGSLLSDPAAPHVPGAKVGRVLASLTAIACLRAQTGVAPQVLSHVFGLRKAFADGTAHADGEEDVQGAEWLASEEGNAWVLQRVDDIVAAIGATYAPGPGAEDGFIKAKL